MKMILMILICIGAQNRPKGAAGRLVHPSQRSAGAVAVPAVGDQNLRSVLHDKSGNVDGPAFAVFGNAGPFLVCLLYTSDAADE